MRVFVLEDSTSRIVCFKEIFEDPRVSLEISDNVTEAKQLFKGNYDLILLDHDLTDEHYTDKSIVAGTGSEFASWLAEFQKPEQGPVLIHSFNPDGAQRMFKTLEEACWTAIKFPFGVDFLTRLQQYRSDTLAAEDPVEIVKEALG